MTDLIDIPVRELLDRVASDAPAPSAGSVAALAVSLAAGLCAMAARVSAAHDLEETAGWMRRAEALRERAQPLVQADAQAYGRVLEARRLGPGAQRDRRMRDALTAAADVPRTIAAIGDEVAQLSAELAQRGTVAVRGDAAAAGLLARASADACARLVEINLAERN